MPIIVVEPKQNRKEDQVTQTQTWILSGLAVVALAVAALIASGSLTSAQTDSPTPTPSASGTFQSNEDPTHESGESSEREAAEDSGQFQPGRHEGGHGSNEDPTHESNESPEREAQEDAGQAPAASTAPGA